MPNRLVADFRTTEIRRTDGTVTRYRPGPDGTITPRDAIDERALREHGAFAAGIGTGMGGQGKTCGSCGFVGWFTKCGRCGGECR
jgi:hypothetical protein